ncbi:glycosyl hydrolase [Microbacterium thalassium]|uniref:Glycosyl hydrolases family 2, sugar binding domain n=1 Tax=Microbacterium thalassium TaxID=362649 RepID=A0A7X0FN42_9MICO|nr:glycosyl hydrolase [Microbacterium thalassium]MBB6390533.1 hypothetical protein [Microbacterium thalassium]GLK25644.1 hypothetical protein GCM10017607_29630 [Microbacterium thalassium]
MRDDKLGAPPTGAKSPRTTWPGKASLTAMSVSAALACGLFAMPAAAAPAEAARGASSVNQALSAFLSPSLDAKPMARMWFPDAGAGADDEGLALVAKHIEDMAAAGFGGVEIAYLADDSDVSNEELATVGWGSENWKRILKTMLKTANQVPGGFKIDITITSHWPPVVNTIDPNDDAQQQQATYAYRKLTAADVAAGAASVPLPTQRTQDFSNSSDLRATFLFVDKLSAATLATVTAVSADGTPTFGLASLEDVTSATSAVPGAGSAAGIPDEATAAALGLDYQTDVIDKWGPEPADPDFDGKIDADGNRKRMADWQDEYSTDLSAVDLSGYSPSDGDGYAVGDLALIGSYHQGTGQVQSGGSSVTQHNRTYATDYFSAEGVQKIFDLWDENLLDDEMIALLEKNGKQGTSIFEDSIEIHKDGALWTADLLDENSALNGYESAVYAPVLAMGSSSMFDDSDEATRLIEDYNLTLGHLYETEHADLIKDWAASFGYTYRAQAYTLDGLDIAGAAATLDIPEGDNSTAGDGIRNLKAATNLTGQKLLSMETYTGGTIFSTWDEVAKVVNSDLSDGVNRSIFHGSAFARAFNGYESSWPGWNFFKVLRNGGFSTYDSRQIWWEDADTFSGYVARSQGVMQAGQAKSDLAVLIGSDAGYSIQSGNSLQEMMNAGYSYNILSQALLEEPAAIVEDGVLDPDGAEYKAVVIEDASKLSTSTVEKLVGYAGAGLPIVVLDTAPTRVYGTDKPDNNDADMLAAWTELTAMPNVTTVADQSAALAALDATGVTPNASYDAAFLEASSRVEGGTTFYYLFNAGTSIPSAASAGDTELKLVSAEGLSVGAQLLLGTGSTQEVVTVTSIAAPSGGGGGFPWEVNPWTVGIDGALTHDHASGDVLSGLAGQDVTLSGSGTPYVLDAWTGEFEPLAEYTRDGDTVTFTPEIGVEDAEFVVLVDDNGKQPHATEVSGGDLVVSSNKLVHHAFEPGEYEVTLADGSVKDVSVSSVPDDVSLADGWDLSLESWGPDAEANAVDPTESARTTVEFSDVALGDWSDLPATGEQLSELGVDSIDEVSGIGTYSTSFSLGKDWRDAGAVLHLEHGADMVTNVVVNGKVFDDVDQLSDTIDLAKALKVGENRIEITIDTTLERRYKTENGGAGSAATGLTGVSLDAYTITTLK